MEYIHYLIDFVLHIDVHLAALVAQYGIWVYAILFVIVFCETGLVVTPFLPGDSLLFVAGALAALPTNGLNVHLLALAMAFAAVLGDASNYEIGRLFGTRLFRNPNSKIFKQSYLEKTHAFYDKYGGKTIVIARFVPVVRTFAPFVAGMGRMSYRHFAAFNVTGGILWVALFIYAGSLMSESGIAKYLLEFVDVFVGRIRGGLGFVATLTCAILGAISGSTFTGLAATGNMLIPEMVSRGYPRAFATALITCSSILGVLIPPSTPMIIFGWVTGTNVLACFLSTVGPGIVTIIIFCGISEYIRLLIIAQGVRDAMQTAVISTVNDNYDDVYHGVREGYSGGYQPMAGDFEESLDYGDIYGRLEEVLGLSYQGGTRVKFTEDGKTEFRVWGLDVDIENAPLAGGDRAGNRFVANCEIELEVPVSFGGRLLPATRITVATSAGYTPRF